MQLPGEHVCQWVIIVVPSKMPLHPGHGFVHQQPSATGFAWRSAQEMTRSLGWSLWIGGKLRLVGGWTSDRQSLQVNSTPPTRGCLGAPLRDSNQPFGIKGTFWKSTGGTVGSVERNIDTKCQEQNLNSMRWKSREVENMFYIESQAHNQMTKDAIRPRTIKSAVFLSIQRCQKSTDSPLWLEDMDH